MVPDEGFHIDLRRREVRELEPLFPAARAAAPSPATSRAAVIPQVGDLLHLNTTAECERIDREVGRVEAITRTAIVVADTSNPRGALGYPLGYARRIMEEGPADLDLVHAGALWELPLRFPVAPSPEVCATASAYGAWLRDAGPGTDYASYALPLGFSVGVPVRLGPEARATPYLQPRLLLVRSEGTALGIPVEESYAAVAITGGLGVGWGPALARLFLSAARLPAGAGVGSVPNLRGGVEIGVRF